MTQTWDVFAAELSDTRRGAKEARPKQPCIYCGKPTKAISRVCLDHDDLIELDPQAPANPEEAYE